MVKVCKDWFPKGSFPYQKDDGYYMDDNLKENLDVCCDAIAKDMDFVFAISGSGMVRVGKSALAQQMGTYITHTVNRMHNLNNTFTIDDILFNSGDLIRYALKKPKYSVVVLDEGDDLTENYWSDLSRQLRRFFRKCGQLNLFLILVLPDFFELSSPVAMQRTIALLNVKFFDGFKRGSFDFYPFEEKKQLYLRGKKFRNYNAFPPVFPGTFIDLYTVGKEAYTKKKREDLDPDKGDSNRIILPAYATKMMYIRILKNVLELDVGLTTEQKTKLIKMCQRGIYKYFHILKDYEEERLAEEEMDFVREALKDEEESK